MPSRHLLLSMPLAAGLVALGWALWPAETRPVAPASAGAASLPAGPAQGPGRQAPEAVAPALQRSPPSLACPSVPPLSAHDTALLRQRAVSALSSGADGDPVLAALLSAPPAEDMAARAAWAQPLVQAALRSQQAAALRWAEPACAATASPLACGQALLRARVQLEPDNAVHWVDVIAADTGDADAAWRGLALARRWQAAPQLPLDRLVRALPASLLAPQREALAESWLAALNLTAPVALPPAVEQACGHHGPGHAIGAACAQLADLMQQADTEAARRHGAELAGQLGRTELAGVPPLPRSRTAQTISSLSECADSVVRPRAKAGMPS